ncbi:MAG TPA: YqiA/YcfP family alpha/beta fold hydrolase [Polyangiaceae bacterium]|nr:YqiA/YcfP family alpha/beta fold hydrolase [Polyangiaceae bacterium]
MEELETPPGPRWLYLHGFASGPDSSKGRSIAAHYARRGVRLERLGLRVPTFERQRLSAMIETARVAIGGERDRAVLFGSSLGGLTACRAAERDARVAALVLLAPAFRFVERWRRRLGEPAWEAFRQTGWLEVDDYAEGGKKRVDFGFALDGEAVDRVSGGFPDVRVPCLVVHGRRDETADVELSRRWAAGKPHVRLVEVDDGHALAASLDVIVREADAFLAPFLHGAPAR